jgi:hypothetical protein
MEHSMAKTLTDLPTCSRLIWDFLHFLSHLNPCTMLQTHCWSQMAKTLANLLTAHQLSVKLSQIDQVHQPSKLAQLALVLIGCEAGLYVRAHNKFFRLWGCSSNSLLTLCCRLCASWKQVLWYFEICWKKLLFSCFSMSIQNSLQHFSLLITLVYFLRFIVY